MDTFFCVYYVCGLENIKYTNTKWMFSAKHVEVWSKAIDLHLYIRVWAWASQRFDLIKYSNVITLTNDWYIRYNIYREPINVFM